MGQIDIKYIIEGLLRWLHVFSGIMWIGHLYFFNFVNANVAPTLDGETKKKVVPELMPRALFFFRWGAAFTWITGFWILLQTYYHGGLVYESDKTWTVFGVILILIVFLAFFAYDYAVKTVLKNAKILFWLGWILSVGLVCVMKAEGFTYRAYAIHLGAMFGTIMAMNVWMRIWPAQRKIIAAVKAGEKPDDALVALAGARSKHNTYMSVPLVFMMLSQHATWATSPGTIAVIVLAGWGACFWLYGYSKTVKGF